MTQRHSSDRPRNDADEARSQVSQLMDDDAAQGALAAIDELAEREAEIEALRNEVERLQNEVALRDAAPQTGPQTAPEPAPEAQPRDEPAATDTVSAGLEAAHAETERLQDQLKRAAADFQNYRRRADNDMREATRRGKADIALAMLDVFDDLTRSLDAAEQAADRSGRSASFDALLEGIGLVHKKFADTLARFGIEPIEAVGNHFDEAEHEALMQQPAPKGTPPGTVLAELQRGYRMGDRVLRHARVIVAN
ncbi:hypothetical protein BH23BAC4_BH23BAC4_12510 [soil metagenome]